MEFFEFLTIIGVVIGGPWALFTGIAKVKAAGRGGAEGTEIRASELRRMIEAEVAEATAPLVRRIETLEAIATDDEPGGRLVDGRGAPAVGAGRLDPAALADVLPDGDLRFEVEPDDDAVPAARRRARS